MSDRLQDTVASDVCAPFSHNCKGETRRRHKSQSMVPQAARAALLKLERSVSPKKQLRKSIEWSTRAKTRGLPNNGLPLTVT